MEISYGIFGIRRFFAEINIFFLNFAPHSELFLCCGCVYKHLNSHAQTIRPDTTKCRSHEYLVRAGFKLVTRNSDVEHCLAQWLSVRMNETLNAVIKH